MITMAKAVSLLVTTLACARTVMGTDYSNSYTGYSSGAYSSSSSNSDVYGVNFFAESKNTYYDGYQQAWRYLGWYVDCGSPSSRYDDEGGHSHDGSHDNQRYQGNMYCQRYLMWAAYVDPSYTGGGIGEYSFYDASTQSWDETACNYHGNGRCAPMDCHALDTTTWELLGVFKEAVYFGNDAFFEQLFKHEGVCVWNDEDLYDFMSEAREGSWSEGCIQTTTKNEAGTAYLYMDLKPTYNGNMTYALYTDEICKTEYDGMNIAVENVAKSMGLLYGDYLTQWNDALEIYKVCQPCRAYNLQYTSSSYRSSSSRYSKYSNGKYQYYKYSSGSSSSGGGGYNKYNSYSYYYKQQQNNGNGRRKLSDDDDYEDPNEGYFQCDDDADYTNVNQCMKFRTHAELEVATWEDLADATRQGGILPINVSGTIFGSDRISREQEQYLDTVRRQEVAQYKAEKAAAKEAVKLSEQKKSNAFRYMVTSAIALAFSVLISAKRLSSDQDDPSQAISEPLYNPNAVDA